MYAARLLPMLLDDFSTPAVEAVAAPSVGGTGHHINVQAWLKENRRRQDEEIILAAAYLLFEDE